MSGNNFMIIVVTMLILLFVLMGLGPLLSTV
jgi:hypothetical protein